jgi:hypothetical protein
MFLAIYWEEASFGLNIETIPLQEEVRQILMILLEGYTVRLKLKWNS